MLVTVFGFVETLNARITTHVSKHKLNGQHWRFNNTSVNHTIQSKVSRRDSTYNTTQHNNNATQQHNKTQHNTTQHNTTQHNTSQHNTTHHNTTQHNTSQHTSQHNSPPTATSMVSFIIKAAWVVSSRLSIKLAGSFMTIETAMHNHAAASTIKAPTKPQTMLLMMRNVMHSNHEEAQR